MNVREWEKADPFIIGKGTKRGAYWHKFQLHSTFHFGVKGPQNDLDFGQNALL